MIIKPELISRIITSILVSLLAIAATILLVQAEQIEDEEIAHPPCAFVVAGTLLKDYVAMPCDMARDTYSVIECESHFSRLATGALNERGLLQIHPIHEQRIIQMGYTWEDMFKPVPNLTVGVAIYEERGWSPWSCKP